MAECCWGFGIQGVELIEYAIRELFGNCGPFSSESIYYY